MEIGPEPGAWLENAAGERTRVEENCVLGRSAGCQVVLRDARVSRRHAMLHRQGPAEFWLVDLGSVNGTRLNGRRVSQPCRLADRDAIEVAGIVLTFRQGGGQAAASATAVTTVEATVHDIRRFDSWLLVADMVGSTQLLRRLESEQAASVTGRWLAQCKVIIDAHRGLINKFLGDGFLAYWPDKSGAIREVAGALQALAKVQETGEPHFRMAVHYGAAISGGGPSLGEESLGGKEVTFVFRMEELAATLGLTRLLSAAAAEKLGPLLPSNPEGRHPLSGFEADFLFYSF